LHESVAKEKSEEFATIVTRHPTRAKVLLGVIKFPPPLFFVNDNRGGGGESHLRCGWNDLLKGLTELTIFGVGSNGDA